MKITSDTGSGRPYFVTLGMFIIDEFSYLDNAGQVTPKTLAPQIGGGGTYSSIGARIWLPANKLGMIIDRGDDFPDSIQTKLDSYGEMWQYRDHAGRGTTRALNSYRGNFRSFQYLTPRIRITPRDLASTRLAEPEKMHFICSPTRAGSIISEAQDLNWSPTTIYEPIPDRCVPEELPSLIQVLPFISILSPNAEEALSLLGMPLPATKSLIEEAAAKFMDIGVGPHGTGAVVIRSGGMGAYVITREHGGVWVDAFWTESNGGPDRIVDVTGAGNSFLGGLAAGLLLADDDVYEASLYGTVSASFVIEQDGLPKLSLDGNENDAVEAWNEDLPKIRLEELRIRHGRHNKNKDISRW